jgi:hypothetical protein
MKKLFVEYDGKKDKSVLCPLAWAHGFYQGCKHGLILPYMLYDNDHVLKD